MSAARLAATVIRTFEGLRLHPYLDSVGVPTIGYGATYYPSGVRVSLQDAPITRTTAEDLLTWMVSTVYLPKVLELCPQLDSDNRIAAITSCVFNIGVDHFRTSTLRRRINERRWDDVPRQLNRWNMAGGVVLSDLVKRRAAEGVLFGS